MCNDNVALVFQKYYTLTFELLKPVESEGNGSDDEDSMSRLDDYDDVSEAGLDLHHDEEQLHSRRNLPYRTPSPVTTYSTSGFSQSLSDESNEIHGTPPIDSKYVIVEGLMLLYECKEVFDYVLVPVLCRCFYCRNA